MLYSMTAFASGQVQGDWGIASCEIRSVNSRYLDLKIVVPELFTALEAEVCSYLRQHLHRGKVACYLRWQPQTAIAAKDLNINHNLVQKITKGCQEISHYWPGASKVDLLQLLLWPGVVEDVNDTVRATITAAMRSLLHTTVQDLRLARQREGAELSQIMLQPLALIATQLDIVKQRIPEIITQQRERFVAHLHDAAVPLEPQQLAQEVLAFVKKIDITEEIARLNVHIGEIKRLLVQGGVVGRRLDFLIQELQREANTLGAKSVAIDITYAAIEMKVLIEQLREQVQNIE